VPTTIPAILRCNLMAVVFHLMNYDSFVDKSGLSKSGPVRIRPEDLQIKIGFNQQYLAEFLTGANTPTFVLLATPIGMKPEDFSTLNQAEDKGAQVIDQGSAGGPPVQVTPAK
jgi:hypothetical protein